VLFGVKGDTADMKEFKKVAAANAEAS